MFEHAKAKSAALADHHAGIASAEGARRFVLTCIGARPAQDSSDPRLQRARAVLGNQSVVTDLEADLEHLQQAIPAGHFGLGIGLLLLFAAESFGCYDILDSLDFAEESRVVVAFATAIVIAWMASLAGNEVSDMTGTAPRSTAKRLLGLGVLSAFSALVISLAFMRVSASEAEGGSSAAEVILLLFASLGPAAAMKALIPRFNEGRAIARALKTTRTKLAAEATKVRQSQQLVESAHASPTSYDNKAAVLTALYLTEFDRAAGRRQ